MPLRKVADVAVWSGAKGQGGLSFANSIVDGSTNYQTSVPID